MANNLTISNSSLKQFSDRVIAALEKKLDSPQTRSKLARSLRPFMEEEISKAIAGESLSGNTVLCRKFIPDIEVVGALGIGVGGSTNDLKDKYTKGWTALLPGGDVHSSTAEDGTTTIGESAAKVTISFAKKSLGKATYTLDPERFYDSKVNVYTVQTNGKRIQWMRQFIKGVSSLDYGYLEYGDSLASDELNEHILEDSRTGLGIMVKIADLQGLNAFDLGGIPNPFAGISTAIKQRLGRPQFAKQLRKLISEAMRA